MPPPCPVPELDELVLPPLPDVAPAPLGPVEPESVESPHEAAKNEPEAPKPKPIANTKYFLRISRYDFTLPNRCRPGSQGRRAVL